MKLYYFETMNPRKVCALAKHLRSPVEYVRLDAAQGEHKQPAHLARNPNGLVPVLVDGERTIWESAAIMVHLALRAGSPMWPTHDTAAQVEVMRWVSWDLVHFMPHAGTFYFERMIKPKLGMGEPDAAQLARAAEPFHASATILDDHLARHMYLVGDELTIADFCVAVLLPDATRMDLPVGDYRYLQRWHGRLMELPAWREPWPA